MDPASGDVSITAKNFDAVVQQSTIPILAYFGFDNCGACVAMKPIVKRVAQQLDDQLVLVDFDVDERENYILAGKLDVDTAPRLLLYIDGQQVASYRWTEERELLDSLSAILSAHAAGITPAGSLASG